MRATRITSTRLVGALLVVTALLLGSCGDDDEASGAGPTEIDVIGVDFAFEGLPDRVVAGTKLNFRNDSAVEVHEIVAVRLVDGEERSLEELLELPDEEADEAFVPGPPALVVVAPPGEDGTYFIGDGTLTEPGRYVLLCGIPTGADPVEFMRAANDPDAGDGPPDVAGGPPHLVHGMIAELWVDPAA